MQQFLDYIRPKPTLEKAELNVRIVDDHYEISLGRRSFKLKSNAGGPREHETYDFALFGALAIGLTHNVEIETDLPISKACQQATKKVNDTMELWQSRKIYPTTFRLNNVVETTPPKSDGPGLICLSGGIDSTYALLNAMERLNITHGLLIAGADYSTSETSGFVSLRKRVEKIASTLGIELIITETSIRKLGFQWEMLHTLNLAMCLSLHRGQFGHGIIAADQTPIQELAHHPWGNSGPLVSLLSNPQFPIHHVGSDLTRSEKTREVINHPSGIINEISVCFEDQVNGGNCGVCAKCTQTRLNILTNGQEIPELFAQNPALDTLVSQLSIPKYQAKKRKSLALMLDIRDDLPDGDVKDALGHYIKRLKSRILPTGRQ